MHFNSGLLRWLLLALIVVSFGLAVLRNDFASIWFGVAAFAGVIVGDPSRRVVGRVMAGVFLVIGALGGILFEATHLVAAALAGGGIAAVMWIGSRLGGRRWLVRPNPIPLAIFIALALVLIVYLITTYRISVDRSFIRIIDRRTGCYAIFSSFTYVGRLCP